jgi:hypothetical protein
VVLPASFPGDKSLSGAGRGQPQAIRSCGKLAQLQEELLPILVVSEDRLPLIPKKDLNLSPIGAQIPPCRPENLPRLPVLAAREAGE